VLNHRIHRYQMDCSYCYTKLLKRDKLCKDCKFNDGITISLTNVKKLYKLTDQDINQLDQSLYHFTYRTGYATGTRYLITEIEDWIEKKSGPLDKSMKAMKKIKEQRERDFNAYKEFLGKKDMVLDLLNTMIEKTNQVQLIDHMKFLINNDHYLGIDQHQIDDPEICEKLLDLIERKAERMLALDQRIKNHYKNEHMRYIDLLSTYHSVLYKELIDSDKHQIPGDKLNKLFNELDEEMYQIEFDERTNQMEEQLVNENEDICENDDFFEFVRMSTGYKRYVMGSDDLILDDAVKKIGKIVRLKIKKKERKNQIDARLESMGLRNHRTQFLDVYKDYVNGKSQDHIDIVMNKIIAEINEIKRQEAKKALLRKHQEAKEALLREQDEKNQQIKKKKQQHVQNLLELDKIALRLGEDADTLRCIVRDFQNDQDNELLLQDFHGDELIFFNLLCKINGYEYQRISYTMASITKKQ
jgi:hypothetical protein